MRGLLHFVLDEPFTDIRLAALLQRSAILLPHLAGPPLHLPKLQRRQLYAAVWQNGGDLPEPQFRSTMALFAIEVCLAGEAAALELCVAAALDPDYPLLPDQTARHIRDRLNRQNWAVDPGPAGLDAICKRVRAADGDYRRIPACLHLAGFSAISPEPVRRAAFEHMFLPLLEHAGVQYGTQAALFLESHFYRNYVTVREEAAHHNAALAAIEPIFRRLARRDAPPPPVLCRPAGRPRVAFFLQNGNQMADFQVLMSFLRGLALAQVSPIEPVIYMLTPSGHADVAPLFAALGIPLLVDTESRVLVERIARARRVLAEENVTALVFISSPLHLSYYAEAPLAPVQIWWAMKFLLPSFPALDGRIFSASLFRNIFEINGARWRGAPIGLLSPPDADPDAVARIRAQYPDRKILGTIAREHKMTDPDFLDAIVRVLQRHPDTCFLWTGREALPQITDRFRAGGVEGRCHFVGWVDPGVYCRVFDLFIETYPLTGLMVGWSMCIAKPVLSVGRLGYLGALMADVLDGTIPSTAEQRAELDAVFAPVRDRLPYLWAATPAEIDALADALLGDDELAAAFGVVQQNFVRRYLSDLGESARLQAENIAAIIAEKLHTAESGMPGPAR